MLLFPSSFGCVYLNTGSQLDSSAWEEIKGYWVDKGIPWSGPNINGVVTVPNGSRLKLQTLAVRNEQLLAGPEWSWIAVDEAHLMKQEYWDVLKTRARRKVGSRKVRVYGLSVSPGHYLVDEFVTNADEHHGCIQYTTYENAHNLPEGQITKYENQFPAGPLRDRYMLGKITAVEGTAYTELVEHLDDYLIDPKAIPSLDNYGYGQDLGLVDPHVLLEGGLGHDGILYIIREYYQAGMDIIQHLPFLKDMYREGWPVFSGHSATQHSLMKREGFNMFNAYKEVDEGIQLVRNRIHLKGLKISKACKNLIREICNYKIKALPSGKEVPEHDFSHSPDALRYLIAGIDRDSIF